MNAPVEFEVRFAEGEPMNETALSQAHEGFQLVSQAFGFGPVTRVDLSDTETHEVVVKFVTGLTDGRTRC